MDVVISLKTPLCTLCDITVKNIETLNVDMKNVHQETDSERICRVTDTVKSALKQERIKSDNKINKPSFDCTECGLIFENTQEQNSHNKKIIQVVEFPTS